MFFRKQEEGLQIFIKGWELYQKIIRRNYMRHEEIVGALRAATNALPANELSILEVGCGDAYAVSQALRNRKDVHYTGIDMSQHALDYAGKNLAPHGWELDLQAGNMFELVPRIEKRFDVIIGGYSLHHFGADRKEILLKQFRPLLTDDGVAIVYDIYKRDGEAREEYLERLLAICRESWSEMDDTQMEQIHDHVRNNDHPESLESMKQLAERSGFSKFENVYRDEDELYGVTTLR